jgi:hypothetical protein
VEQARRHHPAERRGQNLKIGAIELSQDGTDGVVLRRREARIGANAPTDIEPIQGCLSELSSRCLA